MSTAACDSCGAAILWTLTRTGKSMPVDEEPHPDGNVVLRRDGGKGPLIAHVLSKGDHVDVMTKLHRSHFATCPHAARHRRRKK